MLQVLTLFSINSLTNSQTIQDRTVYANQMRKQIQQSIHEKQQATTAIALTLSSQLAGCEKLDKEKLSEQNFDEVIQKVNEFSDYKNLWVQVVSPAGKSLYRSWSEAIDSPGKIRPEFKIIEKTKRPMQTITSGFFDITLKAITPIFNQSELIGYIDVISHFNSLQLLFQKREIKTIVVASPERSKFIKYPFGPHKIDEFYVANLNPDLELISMLNSNLLVALQKQPYQLWNNHLVVVEPIIAPDNSVHGYFYSFSPLHIVNADNKTEIAPDQLKDWLIVANILLSLILLTGTGLYLMRQQTQYFKKILDAENEIVVVTNGYQLIDSNSKLATYFPTVKQGKHTCICELFLEEEGYITSNYQNQNWLDYLLQHQDKIHKVQIWRNDEKLTLQIQASRFEQSKKLAVVVLSDITELEGLNQRLVRQTITDELTRAGNRRYFNKQLETAIHQAKKSKSPLSIIMFDIDFFKKVNDTYGHNVGDEVLKKVSDLSYEVVNHQKIFYRLGGEEFAILLTSTKLPTAIDIAKQLRASIESANFGELSTLTISLGVTQLEEDEEAKSLMQRVDQKLYLAKENGRNQVYPST
ncbi:GGDEF domain-containing protein [Thiomicrorhabdus indica]|uniref:GGDEF domain-containing protein n=1 Tax=Thiomicrorhabdus indica TaxID=2267253 RepID=UPI002AA95A0C|nr:GGDEF domain-containing protein [Thiomicrorhabdus indica]